jgi:predicted dehydrogenase
LEEKYLIIGGGSIGRRHLKNLFYLGKRELFCLRRNKDNAFEREFRCIVLTSFDEVYQLKPDVIFICNPTSLHAESLILAENTGAHVFMEKPLTHSEESISNIKKSYKNLSVFFIGFMLRFHPLVKAIKTLLKEDAIGNVYSARLEFGSFLPYWHPWEDYKIGYAARKDLGGGVINTITHELDLMLHFFGNPEGVVTSGRNIGLLEIEVEELCEAIFLYSWGLATIHLDYLQKDYDRQIRIFGTEGKITWNWHENRVIIARHKKAPEVVDIKSFDVNQLYIDELEYFLKLIEDKQHNHPLDFDYALNNTEWMLKMHKSSENQYIWVK